MRIFVVQLSLRIYLVSREKRHPRFLFGGQTFGMRDGVKNALLSREVEHARRRAIVYMNFTGNKNGGYAQYSSAGRSTRARRRA